MHTTVWNRTSIAFCRRHDQKWTHLRTGVKTCHDVVCCDRTKTAFVLGPGPTVETWDMSEPVPCKKATIGADSSSCPRKLARAHELYPRDLYSTRRYLALSESGQVFVAVRCIGEFVRPCDWEVVHEEDTITDYESGLLVCPYKTVGFDVFKHDGEKWVEVESLKDCAMFLGGNESMMVSTSNEEDYVKGNAIYFTDDYWDRVDGDCCYGGHDMGIFNLEDRRIEPVLGCDQEQRIVPPPFWISVE
ncbi:putative F-box protein at5g55150 [Phtheirospermum japonicum]|uniref:Putative F-box protein at5g55150 n=1 Tax=Phtheirospermum japonicum TaxID=374723 RepID=A0A830CZZ1_9LAMI|nr:putative F-box protein at5g55150 [Phtheirospermum japonicum]